MNRILKSKMSLTWYTAIFMTFWLVITGAMSVQIFIGSIPSNSHELIGLPIIFFFGAYTAMQISFGYEVYIRRDELHSVFNSTIYKKENKIKDQLTNLD